MAVNVSAIIVTPQTRVFTLKKKIPKTNQGSSNAQKKYLLKHTHTQEDRSYLLIVFVIHLLLPDL